MVKTAGRSCSILHPVRSVLPPPTHHRRRAAGAQRVRRPAHAATIRRPVHRAYFPRTNGRPCRYRRNNKTGGHRPRLLNRQRRTAPDRRYLRLRRRPHRVGGPGVPFHKASPRRHSRDRLLLQNGVVARFPPVARRTCAPRRTLACRRLAHHRRRRAPLPPRRSGGYFRSTGKGAQKTRAVPTRCRRPRSPAALHRKGKSRGGSDSELVTGAYCALWGSAVPSRIPNGPRCGYRRTQPAPITVGRRRSSPTVRSAMLPAISASKAWASLKTATPDSSPSGQPFRKARAANRQHRVWPPAR